MSRFFGASYTIMIKQKMNSHGMISPYKKVMTHDNFGKFHK